MLVDLRRAENAVHLGFIFVDLTFDARHVDVVDVLGSEEVLLHLELLVEG